MEKNLKIAGVSLIEVMISMVLISLLLMAVASVFPRMSSHRKAIQESDIAKDIATETLEYLQMYSATSSNPNIPDAPLNGCSGVGNFSQDVVLADVPDDPNLSYKKRWVAPSWYDISWNNPCSGSTGYYPITVTVTWRKQSKNHTITVTGTVQ